VIILLGAVFFFRLAYAEGWIAAVAPVWRCALGALFGVGLVATGELFLRRISRAAAVGFFAAGVGMIYLSVLVAHRQFDLLDQTLAFLLLAVTALIGVGITIRARMLSVGVLSLLAGYATPILTGGESGRDLALALYLTMLLAIVLGLAQLRPQPFRALRVIILPFHALLGLAWIVRIETPLVLGAVMAVLWWAMVFMETLLTALRGQSKRGNVLLVLGATAWLTTALALTAGGALVDVHLAGGLLALVAVASVALVSTFSRPRLGQGEPMLPGLRHPPRSAMELLTMATWLQAGVLLATAAAMQLPAAAATVVWLALGLSAIELGRRAGASVPSLFGVATLLAAIAKLTLHDSLRSWPRQSLFDVALLAMNVTPWGLLLLLASVVTGVAAWRLTVVPHEGDWLARRLSAATVVRRAEAIAVSLCALSITLALAASEAMFSGSIVALLWLGIACLVLARPVPASGRASLRLRPVTLGGATLLAALVRWLANDTWQAPGPVAPSAVTGETLSRAGLMMNLLIALPMAAAAWWYDRILTREIPEGGGTDQSQEQGSPDAAGRRRGRFPRGAVRTLASVAPALSILAAVSLTIWRGVQDPAGYGSELTHRGLWLSMLWALGGVLVIRLGLSRARPADVRLGVVLTAISALAWLFPTALADRVWHGVAAVPALLNLQAFSGAVCIGALIGSAWLLRRRSEGLVGASRSLLALAGVLVLCLGSLEIERAVAPVDRVDEVVPFAAAAVSIWWGFFGAGLVVLGFRRAAAPMRHAGLALLGLTALKFLLLDLRGAENLWRVGAMVIVGLLFVGVSVLYVRWGGRE
jgi:hypothetical protein